QPRQRSPRVDHGHDDRARRDHRGGPADRAAADVVVDHAGSGRDRHQDERAQELDDEPGPQRPLPEGVFLESDQVATPERGRVLRIQIGRNVRHLTFPLFSRPTKCQLLVVAWARPCLTAVWSAAWSRSFWSAYASAKSAIAWSNVPELPRQEARAMRSPK